MRDAMTPEIVHVSPEATVGEVARVICESRVHRVLVVEGRELRGLISTLDLVGVLRDDAADELRSA